MAERGHAAIVIVTPASNPEIRVMVTVNLNKKTQVGRGPAFSITHLQPNGGTAGEPSDQLTAVRTELDHFTRAQQVLLLYENGIVAILATAVLATLLVVALWPAVSHRLLLGWLYVYLAITAIRLIFVRKRQNDAAQNERSDWWLGVYIALTALSGMAWGVAAILFFVPDQPEYVLLVTCLYAVVVAVAAQALAPSFVAFLVFATTMITPLMAMLIIEGGNFYYPLGMLGILYLIATTGFAYNVHRTVISSIALRFENLELIALLQREKKIAEEANVAKSRFIAAASHDLRQPLHALGLFQDALEPHIDTSGRQHLERMRQSIAALDGLFDSLLDISRLDAGVVDVEPKHVELRQLVETLIEEFHGDAVDKGLSLSHTCSDAVAYVDRVILMRIVRNFLSNALHYTDNGSISVRCSRHDQNHLRIEVADTGCGIPLQEQEHVFSAYYQLHNPERDRTKGLGLGLSIVKRLCRLCGFELMIDSRSGIGSTFTVVVPAGDSRKVFTPTMPSAWELRGRLVAVIDDEQDILDSMGIVLERWGCDTVLAESADQAVAELVARNEVPSIIVADYRLRDQQTGVDAIAALRAALRTEIPALLISGETAPERLKKVAATGLRLLQKPVLPGELRAALHQEIIDHPS